MFNHVVFTTVLTNKLKNVYFVQILVMQNVVPFVICSHNPFSSETTKLLGTDSLGCKNACNAIDIQYINL